MSAKLTEKTEKLDVASSQSVRSLYRALELLETLAQGNQGLPLSQLATEVGLPKSTAHRLLQTLMEKGLVSQDNQSGHYKIGIRAFEIGSAFTVQNELRDIARPIMKDLLSHANETVNLAIRDGGETVYVDQAESTHMVHMFTNIGARLPLYCTGVGKALLMELSESEMQKIIVSQSFTPITPHTITRKEDFKDNLRQAKIRGYAVDIEEREIGVHCVAAPILNHKGETVAALSVSGPAYRMDKRSLSYLAHLTRQAASDISRALGHKLPTSKKGG